MNNKEKVQTIMKVFKEYKALFNGLLGLKECCEWPQYMRERLPWA